MMLAGSMGRAAAAAAAVLAGLVVSVGSLAEPAGEAKATAAIEAGDLAVTGFSGTVLAADKLAPGVDPIDRTFIDVSGPSLRIFDTSSLGAAPQGQRLDAPIRLDVPARDIGQVFALAVDPGSGGAANIFAAATSAFGLSIVGSALDKDGKPVRLKSGAPDAVFMEGQFGVLSSNSPGAIYKIDGATGAVSLLADTAFSGVLNSGPGIGGLAYDPATHTLYASDLDSGLIHRFGLDYNVADLGQFDHGVAGRRAAGLPTLSDDGRRLDILSSAFKADDPRTWGFTQPQRRIDALAVHDGRLYYAVAEGPEIWSVGLAGGSFLEDARREVAVRADKPFPVTAIAFDAGGHMLLAQRSPVKSPYDFGSFADGGDQVLRYAPKPPGDASTSDRWKSDPQTYSVGTADGSNAGSGGVSIQYGYKPDGAIDLDTCEGTVALTGDTLGGSNSGVQLNGLGLVRPQNTPPSQGVFVDYDAAQEGVELRGHVGGVAAVRLCGAAGGFPPVEAESAPVEGGSALPPVEESEPVFPPVDEGGAVAAEPGVDGGGGEAFPPVEEEPDGGGGQTTDQGGETAEGGGLVITKAPAAGACSEKGGCAFNIDVTNNSGKALPEIVVSDELGAGAANLDGAKLEGAPPAPWTCTAPPSMTCRHPGPIAAGETVSLPLSFAPTGLGQEPEIQNCAMAQAGGAPAAGDGAQGGEAPVAGPAGPVCAAIPNDPNAPAGEDGTAGKTVAGPITIEKAPATAPCAASAPCGFNIKVSNSSGQEVPGPITITETLSSPSALPAAPWNCSKEGAVLSCTHPGPVPANGSLAPDLSLAFVPPLGATQLENCANLGAPLPAGVPAPAAPACATARVDANAAPSPQLVLAKNPGATQCSDAGGGCRFLISITNPGPGDFNGPITFTDASTAADGKPLPSSIPFSMEQPDGARFNCAKAGQGVECTTGATAATLKPGQTLTVALIFKPGPNSGATAIKNCASLPGGEKQCANIPLINGPLLRAQKITSSKTCKPSCNFTISVTNVGNAVAKGPFTFRDVMIPQGTTISGEGDIICNGFASCSFKKTELQPGESTSGVVTVFGAPLAPSYSNCAELNDGAPVDKDFSRRCVTITEATPQRPKLKLTKIRHPGMPGFTDCKLEGPCKFQIKLENVGDGRYEGPITINDEVPKTSGGKEQPFPTHMEHFPVNDQEWTCTEDTVRALSCTNKKTALEPGQSVTLDINVFPSTKMSKNDELLNCATATPAAGVEVNGRQCASFKLDPFAVQVVKTGDQSCRPGGECRFDIDILDPGPIPHNAPVTVTDRLSGLGSAEIVSITPVGKAQAFPCKPAPTQIPFTCTGDMQMMPGDHNHYTMIVRLPADAKGAAFSNCAAVGGARASAESSDQSCHSVQLGEPEAQPFSLDIRKTGPASCRPGAECAFELTISNTGRKEHVGPVMLTDGLSGATSLPIVSIEPPLPCAKQPAELPFNCRTADDFRLPVGGQRTFRLTARIPRSADSFTNCAILASAGASGAGAGAETSSHSCFPVNVSSPPREEPPTCQRGMVLLDGACVCPPGTGWNGRTCSRPREAPVSDGGASGVFSVPDNICPPERPVGTYPNCCPVGTRYADGACRGNIGPRPPVCEGRRQVGAYPNCCPAGMHFERGACRRNDIPPVTRPPVCEGRRPVGTYPNCCPVGMHFERGACRRNDIPPVNKPPVCEGRRPVGTYPNCCPVGTRFENGKCTRPHTDRCPVGMTGSPPNCCPPGTRFEGGKCVRPHTQGSCPPGTHATRSGGCEANAPPKPNTSPKTEPQKAKCAGGSVGTPPNCRCPPPLKFIGHRCRYAPKPRPGPKPAPAGPQKCPPGMKGPKCDQIIVH